MKRVGIIGCGNMGSAIVSQLVRHAKHVRMYCIAELDRVKKQTARKRFHVCICDIIDLVRRCDIIIVAVKPQDIDEALHEIKLALSKEKKKLIVSIAAGIPTAYIEKKLSKAAVVRVMPNLPSQIGEGVAAIAKGRYAKQSDLARVKNIFDTMGATVVVQEKHMDAVTALSGSGPAYVFYFMQSMIEAGTRIGLQKNVAEKLAFATVAGSCAFAHQSSDSLSSLIAQVTSKGGTTEAAFKVLRKKQYKRVVIEAVSQAHTRARQLART